MKLLDDRLFTATVEQRTQHFEENWYKATDREIVNYFNNKE